MPKSFARISSLTSKSNTNDSKRIHRNREATKLVAMVNKESAKVMDHMVVAMQLATGVLQAMGLHKVRPLKQRLDLLEHLELEARQMIIVLKIRMLRMVDTQITWPGIRIMRHSNSSRLLREQ